MESVVTLNSFGENVQMTTNVKSIRDKTFKNILGIYF